MTTGELICELCQRYNYYTNPTYGREITEIAELLREAACRLAKFSESGLTPEESVKLAKAKLENRLVELPHALGSTVYTLEGVPCADCSVCGDPTRCDGTRCPVRPVMHKVEGYEVARTADGVLRLSAPGEWGFEGLERFFSADSVIYDSPEAAETAADEYNADYAGEKGE